MEWDELLGKRALGQAQAADYAAWAESLLEQGVDSSKVAILAGLALDKYPDSQEVEDYFLQVIKEQQLVLPSPITALKRYAEIVCRRLVAGTISPARGLHTMAAIYGQQEQEELFQPWFYLAEDYDTVKSGEEDCYLFNSGLTADNRDEFVVKTARQFLTLQATGLPTNFSRLGACQDCGQIAEIRYRRAEKRWLPEKLYRFIYNTGPLYEPVCPCCGALFPTPMSDYKGRQHYLKQLGKE